MEVALHTSLGGEVDSDAQQLLELVLEREDVEEARPLRKLNQQVDVTVLVVLSARHTSEDPGVPHPVTVQQLEEVIAPRDDTATDGARKPCRRTCVHHGSRVAVS